MLPEEQKGNKRNGRPSIYESVHVQGVENKAEKFSHGVDVQQKAIWHSPANFDNRMSKKGQKI